MCSGSTDTTAIESPRSTPTVLAESSVFEPNRSENVYVGKKIQHIFHLSKVTVKCVVVDIFLKVFDMHECCEVFPFSSLFANNLVLSEMRVTKRANDMTREIKKYKRFPFSK